MKNLTLEEFEAQIRGVVVNDVLACKEVVRVDCGEAGAFVVMEEPEYARLRDALVTLIAMKSTVENDEGFANSELESMIIRL